MKTTIKPYRPHFGGRRDTFSDFVCATCRRYVSAEDAFSGVRHRNHCPYCLCSRHLDLYAAGDRLSACKAPMRPLALTLKKTVKKYSSAGRGELMLIHQCGECDKFSLNRIAADDDSATLLKVFESSLSLDALTRSALAQAGIQVIGAADRFFVSQQFLDYSQIG